MVVLTWREDRKIHTHTNWDSIGDSQYINLHAICKYNELITTANKVDKKHTNKLRSDQFIADANTHTEQTEIYIYMLPLLLLLLKSTNNTECKLYQMINHRCSPLFTAAHRAFTFMIYYFVLLPFTICISNIYI